MIQTIKIENFKSIVDLKLDLGKFNVIIGTNGCGKTNILEAITLASAAAQDKLDTEYLLNRDIRITSPQFMTNAFEDIDYSEDSVSNKVIKLSVQAKSKISSISYITYAPQLKKWIDLANGTDKYRIKNILENLNKNSNKNSNINLDNLLDLDFDHIEETEPNLYHEIKELIIDKPELSSFLTYRPSETFLRKTFDTSITPIGLKGEGLLRYLKELDKTNDQNKILFKEINNGLHLLDWFDNFSIPEDTLSTEYTLSIGDKYLKESLHNFDQQSTNEGFLFLLFYLTLFNSPDTPKFFAIDNIETSFNPKLCTRITKCLVDTTLEKGKQVIITTHSPYVLDGLDLSNDDIRLFVARRDIDGHTRIERISYREDRTMPLSELWMSGLIGGLPDNF